MIVCHCRHVCRTFTPYQIIHFDDKAMVRLKTQVANLREQLAVAGKQLGFSNAVVETYRSKEDTLEVEFSHVKGAMVKVGLSWGQLKGYTGRVHSENCGLGKGSNEDGTRLS